MKNLLYFASDYKIGLSQVLTDQLISLYEANVPVTAVAGENEQEFGLSQKLSDRRIPITRVPGLDAHNDFTRLVNEIVNLIQLNDIEVVHVQNNWQLAIASVAKIKLLGKLRFKIAYTIHGFRNSSPIKSIIARGIIGSALWVSADHVICMTEFLKKKFSLLSYKIDLIPLGVDENYFLDEFVVPQTDSLHLVFPAQFRQGKNQDMIIRAFAEYVRKSNDIAASLTLPGSGDLMKNMKSLANELGVGNQVIFPGFVSKQQVKDHYLNSNIAIVASNSETFGQSIVEPFVLGRCVISTPVGIATEIIKNEKNGYIFRSQAELTERLLDLHNNRQRIVAMGHENYNHRMIFSWRNVTARYIETIIENHIS